MSPENPLSSQPFMFSLARERLASLAEFYDVSDFIKNYVQTLARYFGSIRSSDDFIDWAYQAANLNAQSLFIKRSGFKMMKI